MKYKIRPLKKLAKGHYVSFDGVLEFVQDEDEKNKWWPLHSKDAKDPAFGVMQWSAGRPRRTLAELVEFFEKSEPKLRLHPLKRSLKAPRSYRKGGTTYGSACGHLAIIQTEQGWVLRIATDTQQTNMHKPREIWVAGEKRSYELPPAVETWRVKHGLDGILPTKKALVERLESALLDGELDELIKEHNS